MQSVTKFSLLKFKFSKIGKILLVQKSSILLGTFPDSVEL
jgi:hypothetical protein